MAEVILMPRLSDTMTEGVIAAWHKKVGDAVKKGDLLAEIETDKATMELESYQEGTLLHLGAENGGKLQVNDLLAIIGKQGEDVSGLVKQHGGGGNGAAAEAPKEEKPKEETPKAETKPAVEAAPATSGGGNVDISKMEEVVLMPRLSDTMTEGVIASWNKKVGDPVKKGEVLAEIETDKATMELESYKEGVLLYQGAKAGEKIQVNDLLCIIGKEGFDVNSVLNAIKGSGGQAAAAPAAEEAPALQKAEAAPAKQEAAPAAEQQVVNEGRIIASPLAKKIAEEKGIDLKYVKGSGDNGRIIKNDVDSYKPAPAPRSPEAARPAAFGTSCIFCTRGPG